MPPHTLLLARTPMMIDAQRPETRRAIEQAILTGAERYRRPGGEIVLRWPALLTVATRADGSPEASDIGPVHAVPTQAPLVTARKPPS
jgi:hypothetical protein